MFVRLVRGFLYQLNKNNFAMATESTATKSTKLNDLYPYPPCWKDDERVQVLLAPFRERSVNSENYDSKMKFWLNIIPDYCIFKGKVYFCKQELQHNFTKGNRVPCCLDTVLEEMQKTKFIRLRKDYEYDPANSWSGWAINNFVKKPVSWGLDKIRVKLGGANTMHLGQIQFIHMEVLNKYCAELQELLFKHPYLGKIYHYEAIQKEICNALNILEETLRICFYTLNVQRKIGLEYKLDRNEKQIHLVKIPSKGDDITITETDNAIHNLEVTKTNLEKQLEDIDIEIKNNEIKVVQCIKENKRLLAKSFLRKKHLLEKNQERRSLALHNIESLLSNVQEAKINGVILDAYKFGSKALQNALESSNLKYDSVDEIVSEVRETMDSYREVQNVLANSNFDESLGSRDSEDELENELEKIMGESNTTTPTKNTAQNNDINRNISNAVEISDAELLDMLNGLSVEQNSPENCVKDGTLGS